MTRRRPGSKPTLALWMLVAVADIALLASAGGPVTVLVVVIGLVTVAAAIAGFRIWQPPGDRPSRVARPRA